MAAFSATNTSRNPGSAQLVGDVLIGGPFLLLSLPPLFLLILLIAVFAGVLTFGVTLVAIPLVPVILLLVIRPRRLLYGYRSLAEVYDNHHESSGRSKELGDIKGVTVKESTPQDDRRPTQIFTPKHRPMLRETKSQLLFSDFVYMLIDFRLLSVLGQIPVPFKHISLQCDEMTQSDIINRKPHAKPAFEPDGTPVAGIIPTALLVMVLRFIVSEGQRQQMEGMKRMFQSKRIRRQTLGSAMMTTNKEGRRGTNNRWGSWGRVSGAAETTLEKRLAPKNKEYCGLAMFEELFRKSLITVPRECGNHALGGTIGSRLGMHSVQCFMDIIAREAGEGDEECAKLIHILTDLTIDEDDVNNDVARITGLLHSVAASGKVFKKDSALYMALAIVNQSDQRVVWTNDRNGDSECVYVIAASHQLRRITVTFRGTTTFNDILKNADFDVMTRPNPVDDRSCTLNSEIELNHGYGEYLFVERDDTRQTKFCEIADKIDQFGRELGDDGYSLYVAGHSMGGALAAMFGIYASADRRFAQEGNPVSVYTFAAAIPGRISFARAFQHQERAGLLRHLRITTDRDIVPLAHPQTERDFAHTGISLCLHDDAIPSVKYVHDLDWWSTWTANIQTNLFVNFPWLAPSTVGRNHGMINHEKLFENALPEMSDRGLGKLTLEDLYSIMNVGKAKEESKSNYGE